MRNGFTLIELVVVMLFLAALSVIALPRFIDLSEEAETVTVANQARQLISNDTLNVAACAVDDPACVDIVSTGANACADAMAAFLPELDLTRYGVRNISSSTPPDQWTDNLQPGEALFWVTRFQGNNTAAHPSPSWYNTWNARQPCILFPRT